MEYLGCFYSAASHDFQHGMLPVARTIKAVCADLCVVEILGGQTEDLKEMFDKVNVAIKDNWNVKCMGGEVANSITTVEKDSMVCETQVRIRKITERESFRLMGVKDEDFDRIAKNQSNSSLRHLAGDSIVVDVLMAIFSQMIRSDADE